MFSIEGKIQRSTVSYSLQSQRLKELVLAQSRLYSVMVCTQCQLTRIYNCLGSKPLRMSRKGFLLDSINKVGCITAWLNAEERVSLAPASTHGSPLPEHRCNVGNCFLLLPCHDGL